MCKGQMCGDGGTQVDRAGIVTSHSVGLSQDGHCHVWQGNLQTIDVNMSVLFLEGFPQPSRHLHDPFLADLPPRPNLCKGLIRVKDFLERFSSLGRMNETRETRVVGKLWRGGRMGANSKQRGGLTHGHHGEDRQEDRREAKTKGTRLWKVTVQQQHLNGPLHQ